jgi:hypothetical protein
MPRRVSVYKGEFYAAEEGKAWARGRQLLVHVGYPDIDTFDVRTAESMRW